MRIGILSDLHIGDHGEGRWHNRQLLDNAEEIARAAVDTLNRQSLDLVVVLGDITNLGAEPHFLTAKNSLSSLNCNWYVVPGNHDRPGLADGSFKRVFQQHYPDLHKNPPHAGEGRVGSDGAGMLFLTEKIPAESAIPTLGIAQGVYNEAINEIARNQYQLLLVFSHFQLESEESYALQHGTGYVDHYSDGHQLRQRLEEVVPGKVVALCGHQHWHHITIDGRYIQCTTGAAVEYPMECRVVSIDRDRLTVETFDTAVPELAAESLVNAPWARGTEHDRTITVELR